MSFLAARRAQMTEEHDFLAEVLQSLNQDGLDAMEVFPGLVARIDALADSMAPDLAAADAVARQHAMTRRKSLSLLQRCLESLRDAAAFGRSVRTDAELAAYFKNTLRSSADSDGRNGAHEALGEAYPAFWRATLDLTDTAVRAYWIRQRRTRKKTEY